MCTVRISIYSANIKNVMKIWFHGKKKYINKKLDKEAKWEDRYKFARIPEKIIKYHWCINKIIKIMSWHCWIALLWLNKTNSVVGRLMFCNGEKKGEWQLSMMSFDTMPPQTVQRPEKKKTFINGFFAPHFWFLFFGAPFWFSRLPIVRASVAGVGKNKEILCVTPDPEVPFSHATCQRKIILTHSAQYMFPYWLLFIWEIVRWFGNNGWQWSGAGIDTGYFFHFLPFFRLRVYVMPIFSSNLPLKGIAEMCHWRQCEFWDSVTIINFW